MKLFLYSGLFPQMGFPKWSHRDVAFKRWFAHAVCQIPKVFHERGFSLCLNSKVIHAIVNDEES